MAGEVDQSASPPDRRGDRIPSHTQSRCGRQMENIRADRELSNPSSSSWTELALTRELYGILQSLNSRPFSKGHDGAIHEAKLQLRWLSDQLPQLSLNALTKPMVSLLETFVARLDDLPPEVVARTLIASLYEVLADSQRASMESACAYVGEPLETIKLDQVVVAVGTTIGLGDEFLVARALSERAANLGGVKLWISSHNADLWRCVGGDIGQLPPPPFGGYAFLESLSPDVRARTAYLYFDFLVSDPSPEPYGGPVGVGYAGRWYMGTREGH